MKAVGYEENKKSKENEERAPAEGRFAPKAQKEEEHVWKGTMVAYTRHWGGGPN